MARLVLMVLLVVSAMVSAPALGDEPVYDLDGETEAVVAGIGAGLFGLGLLIERDFEPWSPAAVTAFDVHQLNGLDRAAVDNWSPAAGRASDYLVSACTLAPLTLLLSEPGSDQSDVLGVMYLETMAVSSGLTYLLKNAFERARPFVYGENPDIPYRLKISQTARRSFPSGHTASAFAAMVFTASVFSRMNPESSARGWVWGGCLTAAATTGYLRYTAGMHFPTDIVAGASLGAFAGWLIPQLHELSGPGRDDSPVTGGARQTVVGFALGF